MWRKKTGFTLVELLTVLAIITMLIGLLVPAMTTVRRMAREAKQKAQLNSIGLALTAFRDDYGDYPPSKLTPSYYTGGQKLAEALLGWDLLGFNPNTMWDSAGSAYGPATLDARRGRYLELGTANAFKVGDLFAPPANPLPLAPDTYVICDSFPIKKVTVGGQTVKAGTPILYYRANTASKTIGAAIPANNIYDYTDNDTLIFKVRVNSQSPSSHPLEGDPVFFYQYISDPKVTSMPWPYRPDSYILISAGADGRYGTADDITNFK